MKGDHVDLRVAGDGFTHYRAVATHQVEYTCRQTNFVEDVSESVRDEWRNLGRLENHGAARGERTAHLQDNLVEREVPGSDGADNTRRFANNQRIPDLVSVEIISASQFGKCIQIRERHSDLYGLRESDRHSHILRNKRRKIIGAFGNYPPPPMV